MKKPNRKPTFTVPNTLICNDILTYSARRLGAVLYSRRNGMGSCCKSLEELSSLSGCAIATVRKGLVELEEAGYITIQRRYCHSKTLGRVVYDRPTYHCNVKFENGYTKLPRAIFAQGQNVSHATFVVLMYLHQQTGNTTRAFPSIQRMCGALGMACASVCRALQAVKQLACWLVQRCMKRNNAFACNSYHVVTVREVAEDITVPFAKMAIRTAVDSCETGFEGVSSCFDYTYLWEENQPLGVLSKLATYVNT